MCELKKLIYNMVHVNSFLFPFKDSPEKLENDQEVLAWGKELVTPRPDGVGLQVGNIVY